MELLIGLGGFLVLFSPLFIVLLLDGRSDSAAPASSTATLSSQPVYVDPYAGLAWAHSGRPHDHACERGAPDDTCRCAARR